jgi:4'-phosphopantetheinyl transferase
LDFKIQNIVSKADLEIKELTYFDQDIDELDLSILSVNDRDKYDNFLSNKRRLEFYYTRRLLLEFNTEIIIEYKASGKPIINEGHISVSHSKNKIIIGLSEAHNLGIDIEFYKEKIHRIKHKFLAPFEIRNFDTSNTDILTIIWSIKEAVYKLEDIEGLRFKDDMIVNTIEKLGLISVEKNGLKHDYLFKCLRFKDYVITYCYLKDN